jgi:beta-lactamase class D
MIKTVSFFLSAFLFLSLPVFAQDSSIKSTPIFQSQFSQNLAKNLQEAKSEGCFILYDLKRDLYIRYNSQRNRPKG